MDRDQINARLLEVQGEIDGLDLATATGRRAYEALEAEEKTLRSALRRLERGNGPQGEDAEAREWAGVVAGLRMRDYVFAAANEAPLAGRAREVHEERFRDAVGASLGGVVFPLDLLGARADAATNLNTDGASETSMFVPRMFRPPLAGFFGIPMPRVPAGESKYVTVTGGSAGTDRNRGVAVDAAEVTHTVTTAKPGRISVRAVIRDEDALRHESFEEAVQTDLYAALGDGMDREIMSDLRGGLEAVADDATALTASHLLGKVSAHVDGVHALDVDALKLILGTDSFTALAKLLFDSTASAGVDKLKDWKVQYRVTAETGVVPAKANNNLQKVLVRKGADARDAVCPVWETGRLVRDPYTNAAKGELALTIHGFYGGTKVLRAAGFALDNFKLA
ncbi:MAG: hypothetical protein OXT63_06245 [Gemmatimonadota bacterium]|nr:hypothetical protein [Gemmatimonadota bacterium]